MVFKDFLKIFMIFIILIFSMIVHDYSHVAVISRPIFVVGLQDSRITVPTAAKKTAVEQELPAVV